MRMRYLTLQNADLDGEGQNGELVSGASRDVAVMAEVQAAGYGSRKTRQGKDLQMYLKNYYNSEAGSVPWQEAALQWGPH